MFRTLFLLFLFALAVMATAQNLVPNGGFEEPSSCIGTPWSYSLHLATPWFSPNTATPDLYTTEDASGCGTLMLENDPNNPGYYREPYEGQRFAGFYVYKSGDTLKDYCSVPLTTALVARHTYRVRARYQAHTYFRYAIDQLGALFTDAPIGIEGWGMIHMEPQVIFFGSPYLDMVNDWALLEGEFLAQGGEGFLTIGSFQPNDEIQPTIISTASPSSAYYLLDDVEVFDLTVGIMEPELMVIPLTDGLTVSWRGVEQLNGLVIYDMLGHQITTLGARSLELPVQLPVDLHPGAYVIRAFAENRSAVVKFIKE